MKTQMVSYFVPLKWAAMLTGNAAEDNPSNDYPDEELSSDDEFSRNPYRYHRDHEEDEYDDDGDDNRDDDSDDDY